MALPTFDQLLAPVLSLASRESISRRTATEAIVALFSLTPGEINHRLPSGGATIKNRTGWAMTFLTKAGLIEKIAPRTYRATEAGKQFSATHPTRITVAELEAIPGYEEAWEAGRAKRRQNTGESSPDGEDASDATSTPNERIEKAFQDLNSALASELREHLAKMDPYRFEQTVVDLLAKMGYGGSRKEAAQVTQKSNDEGIDGVINEDRLGLDVIYIQAKRWQNDIGRQEIQNFVGALVGKRASKGVFITTSQFNKNAVEYASGLHQKVILIDGARLATLMIEYDLGVSTIQSYAVKRLDSDYFSDE